MESQTMLINIKTQKRLIEVNLRNFLADNQHLSNIVKDSGIYIHNNIVNNCYYICYIEQPQPLEYTAGIVAAKYYYSIDLTNNTTIKYQGGGFDRSKLIKLI